MFGSAWKIVCNFDLNISLQFADLVLKKNLEDEKTVLPDSNVDSSVSFPVQLVGVGLAGQEHSARVT